MNVFAQIALPAILIFMMFTMGLSITFKDLKKVVLFPKAFAVGAMLQLITLPLVAFIIAFIGVNSFNLNPLFAVGLMIIAACPGGVTSNMFTYLAKADLALSITLTSIISLISVFTTPFIIQQSIRYFVQDSSAVDLDITKLVLGIFFVSTVPVILGVMVKSKKSELVNKLEKKMKKASTIIFVLIIIGAIIKDWKVISESFLDVGSITITLNISCILIAILVSKVFRLNKSQLRAIAYECGLQNGTMGIFIALTLLKSYVMVVPSGIYAILMYFTGGAYLYIISKRDSKITD